MADQDSKPVDSGALQADIAIAAKHDAPATAPTTDQIDPAAVDDGVEVHDDDGAEGAGDEAAQHGQPNPGKKNTPRGVQKKLDKLTREKYEALAQAQYWEKQAKAQAKPQPKPQKAAPVEGKPTLDQFGNDPEQYLEALAEWKADQRIEAREHERAEREKSQAQAKVKASHAEREKAFAESHPDYFDAAYTAPINYSPVMLDYIITSDKGPDVAYYLAQHLDEAHSIEAMAPHRQAIALDRIERAFETPAATHEAQPTRIVTKAPQPPATVAAAGQARRSIYDEGMTTAERIAMWHKRKSA